MFIGCAGGGDLTLVLEVELVPPPPHAPQGAGAAAGNGATGGDMVPYQVGVVMKCLYCACRFVG